MMLAKEMGAGGCFGVRPPYFLRRRINPFLRTATNYRQDTFIASKVRRKAALAVAFPYLLPLGSRQ
jgi:hypothetical protein